MKFRAKDSKERSLWVKGITEVFEPFAVPLPAEAAAPSIAVNNGMHVVVRHYDLYMGSASREAYASR